MLEIRTPAEAYCLHIYVNNTLPLACVFPATFWATYGSSARSIFFLEFYTHPHQKSNGPPLNNTKYKKEICYFYNLKDVWVRFCVNRINTTYKRLLFVHLYQVINSFCPHLLYLAILSIDYLQPIACPLFRRIEI